jgi:hypothetical protein
VIQQFLVPAGSYLFILTGEAERPSGEKGSAEADASADATLPTTIDRFLMGNAASGNQGRANARTLARPPATANGRACSSEAAAVRLDEFEV